MDSSVRQGVLLLMAAALGYSFLPIIAKIAYAAGLEPVDLVAWRFAVAVPCVWALLAARRHARLPDRGLTLRLLGMGVLFTVLALFAFLALDRIPASIYTVLLYTYPAFVALLSLLLGERLPARGWLALGLTLVGVVLTVPDVSSDLASADPLGMALVVVNSALYSIYIVASGRLLRQVDDAPVASALSITGSLIAMIAVVLVTGLRLPPTLGTWGAIVALAVVATVMPVFAFYAGLHRLGAPRAAILSTAEPVFTLILSFTLLRETMLPAQFAGGALILASAILLQLPVRARRAPAPAPALSGN